MVGNTFIRIEVQGEILEACTISTQVKGGGAEHQKRNARRGFAPQRLQKKRKKTKDAAVWGGERKRNISHQGQEFPIGGPMEATTNRGRKTQLIRQGSAGGARRERGLKKEGRSQD